MLNSRILVTEGNAIFPPGGGGGAPENRRDQILKGDQKIFLN